MEELFGDAHFAPGIFCLPELIFSCRQNLELFGSGLVEGVVCFLDISFPK